MLRPLSKLAWIGLEFGWLAQVNTALEANDYPPAKEGYVMNIMEHLGGADLDSQKEVYEIISEALGYDLVDEEGYAYSRERK